MNGTKVNIDLPHAEQLSPAHNEHHDFFEQDFASNNAFEQKSNDFALKQDTALASDVSLSQVIFKNFVKIKIMVLGKIFLFRFF